VHNQSLRMGCFVLTLRSFKVNSDDRTKVTLDVGEREVV